MPPFPHQSEKDGKKITTRAIILSPFTQSLLTTLKLLLGLSNTPTNVGSCPASKSSVELPLLSEGYPLPLPLPLATPLSV